MKTHKMILASLAVVATTGCVMPAAGYSGGQLSRSYGAPVPHTGVQQYAPRVPRVLSIALLLPLGCIAPNGWETPPQARGATESRSSSGTSGALMGGADINPCTKPR